jgi:hypothetical protein
VHIGDEVSIGKKVVTGEKNKREEKKRKNAGMSSRKREKQIMFKIEQRGWLQKERRQNYGRNKRKKIIDPRGRFQVDLRRSHLLSW